MNLWGWITIIYCIRGAIGFIQDFSKWCLKKKEEGE